MVIANKWLLIYCWFIYVYFWKAIKRRGGTCWEEPYRCLLGSKELEKEEGPPWPWAPFHPWREASTCHLWQVLPEISPPSEAQLLLMGEGWGGASVATCWGWSIIDPPKEKPPPAGQTFRRFLGGSIEAPRTLLLRFWATPKGVHPLHFHLGGTKI